MRDPVVLGTTLISPDGSAETHEKEEASALQEQDEAVTRGIFVAGKFDQMETSRNVPFQGIVDALSDLCDVLASRDTSEELVKELQKVTSRSDLALFSTFMTSEWCNRLVPRTKGEDTTTVSLSEETGFEGGSELYSRLKQSCCTFLGLVAKKHPLLLFVDDVQWADFDSLEMLKALIRADTQGILFIIAARDDHPHNRSSPSHPGTTTHNHILEFLQSLDSTTHQWIEVHLSSLNFDECSEMLNHLLTFRSSSGRQADLNSSNQNSVLLYRLVHEKSGGCPLDILQFLDLLRIEGLLWYSRERKQWEWDSLAKIARQDMFSNGTSNDLFASASIDARLYRLSPTTRSVLVLAAHLGFEFRPEHLKVIASRQFNETKVDEALEEAERQSLVLSGKDGRVKIFMHDRVQYCLCDMVPSGTLKERLHLTMGRRFKAHYLAADEQEVTSAKASDKTDLATVASLDKSQDAALLHMIVDNMNEGRKHITDRDEQMELVRRNQMVAQRAASLCSYSTSVHYLCVAIEILQQQYFGSRRAMWSSSQGHFQLVLDLHGSLAQVACNCRQLGLAHRTVDMILAHARSILDKQSALYIRCLAFDLEGRYEMALATGLSALQELGMDIRENPSKGQIISRFLRIKSMLLFVSTDDLMNLPATNDPLVIAKHNMLRIVGMRAGSSGKDSLLIYSLLEAFRLSLVCGRCDATPSATAGLGIVESLICRNIEGGVKLARLAMKMIDEFGAERDRAFTTVICNSLLLCYRDPISGCHESFQRGIESGLKYSETYFTVTLASVLCSHSFAQGMPLKRVIENYVLYSKRLTGEATVDTTAPTALNEDGNGNQAITRWSRCYWQTALNHMSVGLQDGTSVKDRFLLKGEALDEDEILLNPNEDRESMDYVLCMFCKCTLAFHYLCVDDTLQLSSEVALYKRVFEKLPATNLRYAFVGCLTHLDLYHRRQLSSMTTVTISCHTDSQKRQHLARARRFYRTIAKLSRDGCHFATCIHGIVKAEMDTVRSNRCPVKAYEVGIQTALDTGFLQYAAIGAERLGNRLYVENNKVCTEQVRTCWTQALALNEEWEAYGKVEWFKRRYMKLMRS